MVNEQEQLTRVLGQLSSMILHFEGLTFRYFSDFHVFSCCADREAVMPPPIASKRRNRDD